MPRQAPRPCLVYLLVVLILGVPAAAAALVPGAHRVLADRGRSPVLIAEETPAALDVAKEARHLAAEGDLEAALQTATEALALAQSEFGDEHAYVGFVLDDIATLNYRLGRPEEALTFAEQAVPLVAAARGTETVDYAVLANNQATILTALGRFRDALPLYLDAHRVFEEQLGPAHARTAGTTRNLGIAYSEMGQPARARDFFEQAIAARRELDGADSSAVAEALLDRAGVDLRLEDVEAARAAAERALTTYSQQSPPHPEGMTAAEVMLARADIQTSDLGAAEQTLERAKRRLEAAGRAESQTAAAVLYNLGSIQVLRGQSVEAERTYKQVLGLYRRQVGSGHPAVARTLHSLAIIYGDLGQHVEAERLFRRAIAIFEESFGSDDPSVAASRLEMGLLLSDMGRAEEAIAEAEAALAIYERLGEAFPIKRAYATSSLGFALHAAGQLEAAAETFERALALMIEVRGPGSSDLPPGYTELGRIYTKLGRYEEAEARLARGLAIREKDRARTPHGLAESLSALADLRIAQGSLNEALGVARRMIAIMRERLAAVHQSRSAVASGEQRARRELFEQFLTIARAARSAVASAASLDEMFEVAQFPQLTGTTAAISRMAVRFAAGEDDLAALLRERQDTLEQWRALDALLTTRLAEGKSEPEDEAALRADLEMLSSRLAELDAQLRERFPEFAELTQPRPVELESTRALLQADEALLLQVTDREGSHLFFVRPEGGRYARTDLGDNVLTETVEQLRGELNLMEARTLSDLPPFDTDAAHQLYDGLLAPFEEQLAGIRHLIFMPDRAMQNLSPHLLVRTPADRVGPLGDFTGLDFLIRHHAVSVVPSVSALRALRELSQRSQARAPFVGFGDPEFRGEEASTRGTTAELVYRHGTTVDIEALRQLPPLPDSRVELRALADALDAGDDVLFLGERANETQVKNTDLRRYRVLALATHGFLAGEFPGIAEPALALTPPQAASPENDGLLTASEVAALQLDADLVILSACNTAAPAGQPGAEGLSGLARAFFYAGSRTLYVSHWYVDSQAAAWLTTTAAQALRENTRLGAAEALRLSMLGLLDEERGAAYAHPAFWAPFVTVGEGQAR